MAAEHLKCLLNGGTVRRLPGDYEGDAVRVLDERAAIDRQDCRTVHDDQFELAFQFAQQTG